MNYTVLKITSELFSGIQDRSNNNNTNIRFKLLDTDNYQNKNFFCITKLIIINNYYQYVVAVNALLGRICNISVVLCK